jgi:thiol-disulfide isomerase/thioredoxin
MKSLSPILVCLVLIALAGCLGGGSSLKVKPGDPVPTVHFRHVDGTPLKLADYQGKVVLLDFWATWCGPCLAEIPHLKEVYDAYKDHPRFAMISLSLDESADLPKALMKENGMAWINAYDGPWSESKTAEAFGVNAIPQIVLIGPDQKILATGLRGGNIMKAVAKALK